LKIDQDLGNNLSSKKPINTKPILIGLIIVVILAIIIGIVLFVLPNLTFQETTDNNEPINLDQNIPPQSCVYITSLTPSKLFAIASEGNTTEEAVSLKNNNSKYFMLTSGKEFIANPYVDQNDNEEKVAKWLNEQGVKALVLGGPNDKFVYAFKQKGIECYKSTEVITYLIKETIKVEPTCTTLNKTKLSGVIAIASETQTQEGIVSLEDYNAPYFQIYDGNTFVKNITNPVRSGGTITSLINLLIENNVEIVVAGTPREEFYTELVTNEIKCVNSTEVISYVISKIE